LGEQQPSTLATLFPTRRDVAADQLDTASRAWNAFTSPDPRAIETGVWAALPYLTTASRRWLEEFPSTRNGLSRSRRQILDLLNDRPYTPVELFVANGDLEAGAHYLGDWSFFAYLRELSAAASPALLDLAGQPFTRESLRTPLAVTAFGRDLLAGRADWIRTNGIDRWLGGVHMNSTKSTWRWSGDRLQLPQYEEYFIL
jgi:hypothetical protein